LPIIGLVKKNYNDSDVYITPTKAEVLELIESGCDMIALDGTKRKRPNGESLPALIEFIHKHHKLAMADVSTLDEALSAESIGFDCVSTTLSGYTPYSPQIDNPDYELIKACVSALKIPVIAEGRISEIEHLEKVLKINPYAVVIGSAITRPQLITKKFVDVFKEHENS
jgi:N-acylglucosamine-6-phosphate 2-epimerase